MVQKQGLDVSTEDVILQVNHLLSAFQPFIMCSFKKYNGICSISILKYKISKLCISQIYNHRLSVLEDKGLDEGTMSGLGCSKVYRWSVAEPKPEFISPTVLTPYSSQQTTDFRPLPHTPTSPFTSVLYSKWQINHPKILPLGKCSVSTQELTPVPFHASFTT